MNNLHLADSACTFADEAMVFTFPCGNAAVWKSTGGWFVGWEGERFVSLFPTFGEALDAMCREAREGIAWRMLLQM